MSECEVLQLGLEGLGVGNGDSWEASATCEARAAFCIHLVFLAKFVLRSNCSLIHQSCWKTSPVSKTSVIAELAV